MKKKRSTQTINLFAIAIAIMCVLNPYAQATSKFENKYQYALNKGGAYISGIRCDKTDSYLILYATTRGIPSLNDDDKNAYKRLIKSGISEDMIFFVTMYEQFRKGDRKQIAYINRKISVLYIDSNSSFHFSFPDSQRKIYLQLSDPNMKPIVYGEELPKNSTVTPNDDGNTITILDSIYLWENNATEKMLCSMEIEW
jgi:hypothetical protein